MVPIMVVYQAWPEIIRQTVLCETPY
jgi:hypothetical protein